MPLLMYACLAIVKVVQENEHAVVTLVMHIRSIHMITLICFYPCTGASIKLCIYIPCTIYDGTFLYNIHV